LSIGTLAATPTTGISAWLAEDTPGRRAIRRLLPAGIVAQLVVAGAAQWMDLEDRIGEPRTWTLVMFVSVSGVAALSASAAYLVDRLSDSARRVEIAELRLIAADRAAKVAEIARLLAAASSTEEVAEIVNRAVARPFGASGASIGLIDQDRTTLHIVHGTTVPEATRRILPDPPLSARMAFTDAARDGEPVLLEDVDANRARYPQSVRPTGVAGVGARAALPMRDREGRCFGAVAVAWSRPAVFDAHTRATLETVAQLIAQTLERTRLSDEVALQAERNRQLSLTAEALGSARNVQNVVDVLQERLATSIAASYVTVGLVDPLAGLIHRYLPATTDPRLAERFAFDSLRAHRPLVDAARDGREVVIAGRADLRTQYPELAESEEALGLLASVNLPLVDVTGRPVGALAVAWEDERLMDTTRVSTLGTIAQMTGQTLERVRLAEAEHRLVKNLQERILRPMPELNGFALAARYRPAAVELGMGGDWFEGIELDGEAGPRLAVVVGDVVGHGIDAISDMSYLRSGIATLLRTGAPLADLFTAMADVVDPIEVTATALVAVFDACSAEVELLSAGHPPPIMVSSDGVPEVLETGRQPLIGVGPIGEVSPARVHLAEGATIALYTDGLVEERRRSIDDGIGRLAALLVETRRLPVEHQVEAVLRARVEEGRSEDDIALVLVRRTAC
jgi:GAF domain-containing protein